MASEPEKYWSLRQRDLARLLKTKDPDTQKTVVFTRYPVPGDNDCFYQCIAHGLNIRHRAFHDEAKGGAKKVHTVATLKSTLDKVMKQLRADLRRHMTSSGQKTFLAKYRQSLYVGEPKEDLAQRTIDNFYAASKGRFGGSAEANLLAVIFQVRIRAFDASGKCHHDFKPGPADGMHTLDDIPEAGVALRYLLSQRLVQIETYQTLIHASAGNEKLAFTLEDRRAHLDCINLYHDRFNSPLLDDDKAANHFDLLLRHVPFREEDLIRRGAEQKSTVSIDADDAYRLHGFTEFELDRGANAHPEELYALLAVETKKRQAVFPQGAMSNEDLTVARLCNVGAAALRTLKTRIWILCLREGDEKARVIRAFDPPRALPMGLATKANMSEMERKYGADYRSKKLYDAERDLFLLMVIQPHPAYSLLELDSRCCFFPFTGVHGFTILKPVQRCATLIARVTLQNQISIRAHLVQMHCWPGDKMGAGLQATEMEPPLGEIYIPPVDATFDHLWSQMKRTLSPQLKQLRDDVYAGCIHNRGFYITEKLPLLYFDTEDGQPCPSGVHAIVSIAFDPGQRLEHRSCSMDHCRLRKFCATPNDERTLESKISGDALLRDTKIDLGKPAVPAERYCLVPLIAAPRAGDVCLHSPDHVRSAMSWWIEQFPRIEHWKTLFDDATEGFETTALVAAETRRNYRAHVRQTLIKLGLLRLYYVMGLAMRRRGKEASKQFTGFVRLAHYDAVWAQHRAKLDEVSRLLLAFLDAFELKIEASSLRAALGIGT
jgi:hypothetical protein